jgi:serine beta-lactamase-like protein LACTB, mitochondrial
MTSPNLTRRLVGVALAAGVAGALTLLTGWRLLSARLLHVEPPGQWNVERCPGVLPDAHHAAGVEHARAQLLDMMKARRIPGMSVTVAVDGRVVWSEGFGYADAEAHKAACPDTRFRTASVAKPITAAAMARLYDVGRLKLDVDVRKYVPTFPQKGSAITARQLASHRAGIRDYRDDNEAFTQRHFQNVTESLQLFQDDALLFSPGSGHHYSSFGYVLLSAAIEGASGQAFGDYLKQHVFGPLNMKHSSLERTGETVAGTARFYDHVTPYVRDGAVHPSPLVDMSSKWAGGGMLSTTEDLARFGSALLPGSDSPFLAPATREMLFKPLARFPIPLFGYALGWITARDIDLRRVNMHFGAGSGTTTWLGIFPDQGVVIAVMANLGHAGFTYASTIGLGSRFARQPIAPVITVAAAAFYMFAGASVCLVLLTRFVRQRLRRLPG